MPLREPMYATPFATTGLASKDGLGAPAAVLFPAVNVQAACTVAAVVVVMAGSP